MSAQLNQHLGKKLRLRRTSLGLTQTQVAQAINVTFQQIQKYEKGTNGVSSARLLQLSSFLKVPIKYFFEDYQDRILFGKDIYKMDEYYIYFQVLETDDEYIEYYRKRHGLWRLYGLNLSDEILKKVYYQNALKIFPNIDPKLFK